MNNLACTVVSKNGGRFRSIYLLNKLNPTKAAFVNVKKSSRTETGDWNNEKKLNQGMFTGEGD